MVRRTEVTGADGVLLAAWEFADPPKSGPVAGGEDGSGAGGERPGVLLLHGLMGRASHWARTARRLSDSYRAVALDQRGHGRSGKPEGPYGRAAFVADAERAVEQLGLSPLALVGHGMGALTAWELAAHRPDLVDALVICDMKAAAPGEHTQQEWAEWFDSWPLPFASLGDVRKWFGEDDPFVERPRPSRGEFFAEVMAEQEDGRRPVFDPRHMLDVREGWLHEAHWEELGRVRCPTLVVRGVDGELGRAEAQEMVRVLPRGIYAEIADAGPLCHLDRPDEWHRIIEPFLRTVVPAAT